MKNTIIKKIFTFWVLTIILIVIILSVGFLGGLLIGIYLKTGNSLNVLSSFSTPIVALATIIYVILTYYLLRNNNKLLKLQNNPRVFVGYETDEKDKSLTFLFVENLGMGPALDIRLSVNPDMSCYDAKHKRISDHPFLRNGVAYLSPGKKVRTFLTGLRKMEKEEFQKKPIIKAVFKNLEEEKFETEYVIDFSYMADQFV